jgi:putative radical SAM enzyme (TIGR03279 family)
MGTAKNSDHKGALITEVFPGTIAEEIGLEKGDRIIEINHQRIMDLIEFEFLWADEEISLLVKKADGDSFVCSTIEKDYDEPLGAEFASGVFDKVRVCHNKCLFCFVDQMPPGMRSSLYDKDDDYRLSFLQGNFITLTNLTADDKNRIKNEKLSPLFVSVQSVDPDNRVELLKNPKAGQILKDLKELTSAGIEIHAQIVLCKGHNDGEYLKKSIEELMDLGPNIVSLGIVPVGVTKYRDNLCYFPPFTKEDAECIIKIIEKYQKECLRKKGYRFVYLADEFYIKAAAEFPPEKEYDEFFQLENGIGLSRLFINEYLQHKEHFPDKICGSKNIYVISGKSPASFLQRIIDEINEKISGLTITLIAPENLFFGERVTVTGLLTGSDLIEGLQQIPKEAEVLIPAVMLKQGEEIFLDNLTIKEVEEKLEVRISVFNNTFTDFIKKVGI